MGWVRCGGGSSSTDVHLQLKFQDGTSGQSTYTIDEDGIYLVAALYQRFGSGSVTLPSGVTADYSYTFDYDGRGMTFAIASLSKNDVVTITTSFASSWPAGAKIVVRLPMSVSSMLASKQQNDTTCTFTASELPSGSSGEVLCFCGNYSQSLTGSADYSYLPADVDVVAGVVGTNTFIRIFICDVSIFPDVSLKSWSGGSTMVAVMQ